MQDDPARLSEWEAEVGGRAEIASYYYGFGDVFPAQAERTFSDGGTRKVLLSWDMGPTRFSEWASGRYDDYLDQIAAAARAYPYQVYVRPWPEMNGDWQTFQPTAAGERAYGGTYREFKLAWRHVVTYLRAHGADNLRWVFNPTVDTYAETTPVRRIWPGAQYVDVLGLDGFNWGRDSGRGRWTSFSQTFRDQYANLTELDSQAPVWICEVASKEPRIDDGAPADPQHTKAGWVRAMFDFEGMPRLRAVVWFDAAKERDWRAASSLGSQRQWQRVMSDRAS
ncbi:glycoside hydrolase family 26 protein [Nocardioides ungokensis]|uniref:glycoside hydrolase family 26 protein n=1 Tax=Nocardioides ungokensis TaxID=1643322 RepID=UPI0015DD8B98|nr:glycosyl hydrolase [Nocardioides ungokensis]